MLHLIRVLVTLTAAVVIPGLLLRSRLATPKLGWMSAEWLEEHRAARRS